jgi:hypothetical protein
VIKSRRIRWAGHIARMGEKKNAYKVLAEKNLKETDHSKELNVDGKIILEWVFRKSGGKVWIRFIWLRIGTSGGLL